MNSHAYSPPRPLDGLRVLIPRGGDLGQALAANVSERGGIPTVAPLVATIGPRDPASLVAAVERWNSGHYDWIVVTSATTASILQAAGILPKPHAKTGAVGPVTAAAFQSLGFRVQVIPGRDFSAEGLAVSLTAAIAQPGARILLPVSELASTRLELALRDAGHEVDRVGAYSTAQTPEIPGVRDAVAAGSYDVVLVTSGSAAHAIASRLVPLPGATKLAAIGRPSAQALAEKGLRADIIAELSTTDGLLDAVAGAMLPAPNRPS